MNDPSFGPQPNWIPLKRLIETRLFDIIRTEHNNGQYIRLYEAGDYWHAFEESAYQLSRLFRAPQITILTYKGYPFPVIMASISDAKLRAYGKNHIFRRESPGYRELVGMEIPAQQYMEWRRKEML